MKTKNQVANPDFKKLSDEELLHRYIIRNEEKAFCCLFDRYGHVAYGVCFKYFPKADVAKSKVQELFINLLNDLGNYQVESFKPWLYQYIHNFCKLGSGKPVMVANNLIVSDAPFEFAGDHDYMLSSVSEGELQKGIADLNSEQKNYLELFYLENKTLTQIAEATATNYAQVKNIIQQGRQNLKTRLLSLIKVTL